MLGVNEDSSRDLDCDLRILGSRCGDGISLLLRAKCPNSEFTKGVRILEVGCLESELVADVCDSNVLCPGVD